MNMRIWEIAILNQVFIRGSYTQVKFLKKKVLSGKSAVFVIGPICTPHSICPNFDTVVLYGNVALSIAVLSTKKR